MVGMVEIELDKLTGKVDIIDYMAVVDCGIPINPALARIQTEGGIVQGIGHTLMENVTYDRSGRPAESSFMRFLDQGHRAGADRRHPCRRDRERDGFAR